MPGTRSLYSLPALVSASLCSMLLADSPDASLAGPAAEAWFGASLAWDHAACEGSARLIIGSPMSDAMSSTGPGSAMVYDADALVLTFEGEANGDKFGTAVAGPGDLNGDGVSDWIVGAPSNDDNGEDAGKAYIFCGSTGDALHIIPGEADDWFGFSAASLGDVNHDGVNDFAIGARRPSGTGYVRIYSGKTFDVLHHLSDLSSSTHFGASIAGGGDVDSDGTPDLIVGAPLHSEAAAVAGRASVFSGATGELVHTFDGEASLNFLGISVAIAGDVNGDGHADVLIGADGHASNAGRAYLYSGSSGELVQTFTGAQANDRLGRGVAGAGDSDGDGNADVMIGQPSPGFAGGSGNGRVFIYDGETGQQLSDYSSVEFDDFFGFTVAGPSAECAHQPHLLMGAFASDANGSQSGRVDVYLPEVQQPGDLNGDGVINVSDMLALLGEWGPCKQCSADLTSDGVVNVSDLLLLLGNWG